MQNYVVKIYVVDFKDRNIKKKMMNECETAEFWKMIQIGIIKEEGHSEYTQKSEDQEWNQRCGNEHCLHKETDRSLVSCFVKVCISAW